MDGSLAGRPVNRLLAVVVSSFAAMPLGSVAYTFNSGADR